jgi:hypothetical protein
MSTTLQIMLWATFFVVVRLISFRVYPNRSARNLNEKEKDKLEMMLFLVRIARILSVFTLIVYASPYHEVVVEKLGWFAFIVSVCTVVIPLQTWWSACMSALHE